MPQPPFVARTLPLLLLASCSNVRYEPRAPIVARSADGTELQLVSENHRAGLFVHGSLEGMERTTRFRLRAAPGTTFEPDAHRQTCSMDASAVEQSVEIAGDRSLMCTYGSAGSGGFHTGTSRWVRVRPPDGFVHSVAVSLPVDPAAWRRVRPFAIGASLYIARAPEQRISGAYALPFSFAAWIRDVYLAARAGIATTGCNRLACEVDDPEADYVRGYGFLYGLDARIYKNLGRQPFAASVGVRVEQIVSWLPTREGLERVTWFNALGTFHFALTETRGWAGETGASKGLAEVEFGVGVSLRRDDGDVRVGLATSGALNVAFAQ